MRKGQKICKIINEIAYYLVEEYSNHFNIEVIDNEVGFLVKFTLGLCEGEALEDLKNIIDPSRDPAIEEYGSFLVGESDDSYDFELLGSMVDFYNVYSDDKYTYIEVGINE